MKNIKNKMIDKLQSMSDLEFYRHYFSHKPVLLKDCINHTSYFKKWSFNFLKEKLGSRTVQVRYIQTGIFNQESEILPMHFGDLIDLAIFPGSDSKSYYLQATPIHTTFPELISTLERPQLILDTDLSLQPLLWIGGKGCVSPLHYDHYENLLVQVKGTKSITMYPPSDTPYLYANVNPPRHLSAINLEDVNTDLFPLFPNASPIKCTISAGDILYIPPNWWHHVKTVEASISINYWFERFDVQTSYGLETKTVEKLIEEYKRFTNNGSPVDRRDVEGEPLLIKAIKFNYPNVVEALLKLGADTNTVSSVYMPGVTALQLAIQNNNENIVKLLRQYQKNE